MMKRIMTPRAAALAIAAPLLFTAPALADHDRSSKRVTGSIAVQTGNGSLHLNLGHRGPGAVIYNAHHRTGYRYASRGLKRQAIRACRAAIRQEARYRGFRDIDFDDGRYAEQIGPRGFRVTFNEVEFEGFRREYERPVTCIVRGGDQVRDIRGIPKPGKRGQKRRYSGYRY